MLTEWWELPLPRPPRDAVELLGVLQAASDQLPWPQDAVLAAGSRHTPSGEEIIAQENQAAWEAVALPSLDGTAQVAFLLDDGQRRSDDRLALDEFLFRLTVEAASLAGASRLRCRPAPDPAPFQRSLLVERWMRERHEVQFPALFGGPGWLATGHGSLGTNEPPAELVKDLGHLGDEWTERVIVEIDPADVPADADPWHDIGALGGRAERWIPVGQPGRSAP